MSECEQALLVDFVSAKLSPETRDKYERFLLAHALEKDPDWRPCLTADCPNGKEAFLTVLFF